MGDGGCRSGGEFRRESQQYINYNISTTIFKNRTEAPLSITGDSAAAADYVVNIFHQAVRTSTNSSLLHPGHVDQ